MAAANTHAGDFEMAVHVAALRWGAAPVDDVTDGAWRGGIFTRPRHKILVVCIYEQGGFVNEESAGGVRLEAVARGRRSWS